MIFELLFHCSEGISSHHSVRLWLRIENTARILVNRCPSPNISDNEGRLRPYLCKYRNRWLGCQCLHI